ESFLDLLLYALIPWSAINLVDYFLLKKGHYVVSDLFLRTGGRYGRWSTVGLVSYFVGLTAQVPFMMSPLFNGPLAESMNYIDISWLIGFVFTALLFLVLHRLFAPVSPPAPGLGEAKVMEADAFQAKAVKS